MKLCWLKTFIFNCFHCVCHIAKYFSYSFTGWIRNQTLYTPTFSSIHCQNNFNSQIQWRYFHSFNFINTIRCAILRNLDLIKFVICTLVSRVHMASYALTKGFTVPGNQDTHNEINQIQKSKCFGCFKTRIFWLSYRWTKLAKE